MRLELTEQDYKNILGWCETKFDDEQAMKTPGIDTKIKIMTMLMVLREHAGRLPNRGPF